MKIFLIVLISLFASCSKENIKRQVYFNFYLGSSTSEFAKELQQFESNNNEKRYFTHTTAKNDIYYSSLVVSTNKYDSVINKITIFYFLDPSEYTEKLNSELNNTGLVFIDAQSREEVDRITKSIIGDLSIKYGEANSIDTTTDVDFDPSKTITYKWDNKNDVNIKLLKYTNFVYDPFSSSPKYFFGFRLVYQYTDRILNKYFKSNSPY